MAKVEAAPRAADPGLFPDVESEEVPCFLCGAAETRALFQGRGFQMGRCLGCGLVRQNPRLTQAALVQGHYDGAAQSAPRKPRAAELPPWLAQPLANYEQSVNGVLAHWPEGRPKGRWVDVGAAGGALLYAAHAAGWEAAGVEVGEAQARQCREVHGFEVFHGTLEEAGYPDGFASVVSFRHVLEHLHDVLGVLAEARRILAPDGLLLIEVPNYAGIKYALGRLRRPLRLGRDYWLGANIPEHLYYFSPHTMRRTLEEADFRVVAWSTYGKHRARRRPVRKAYDGLRDGLRIGNKLRVLARPSARP